MSEEREEEPLAKVQPAPECYVTLYENGNRLRDFVIDGKFAGEKRFSRGGRPSPQRPQIAEVAVM